MTKQIETATIVGTIVNPGNATITVTALGMTNSPKAISVAVLAADDASAVALKARQTLALDVDVQAFFTVSGATTAIILTARTDAGNDTTMNIASANGTCTGLTAQPTSTHTQAGAGTITNGYCTLADFKTKPVLSDYANDNSRDQFLCDIITAVSRAIDNETSRYFYQSAAHEVRYFTARDEHRILIGDYVSITALYTDNLSGDRTYPYTWATTDYDMWPYDAATFSEAEPYRYIDITPRGLYQFPKNVAKGVKVDAIFGWPVVPQSIQKACLLWSERVFKRYQTPLGISAMTALGQQTVKVPPPDPDVQMLYANYKMLAV